VNEKTVDPVSLISPLAEIGRSIADGMAMGALPWPGGLMQQPARALRLGRLWKNAVAACEHRRDVRRGL
jgi:hypothetical protein